MDSLTQVPPADPTREGDPISTESVDDAPPGSRRGGIRGWFARGLDRLAAVPLEGWVTFAVVLGCGAFVFGQLHPGLLLSDTTPAGGDMGAHVWGPAYLRDHLLEQGRWSGWSPDWYAGFPAYHFYMVPPSLAIALLSWVLPYGVAFKLVTVSGVVTLPVTAWAFGRLSALRFPGPALLAVGATVFLFDRSFSIYGGNIASTLAGEFAFSISLSIAVLYLGVVVRGMRTGRGRGWAALLLALCGLTHIIPAFWALVVTALIWLVHAARERELWVPLAGVAALAAGLWSSAGGGWGLDLEVKAVGMGLVALGVAIFVYLAWEGRRLATWLLWVLPVGGLLSAFWVLPFFAQRGYLNDMGWEKKVGEAIPNYLFTRAELDPQLVDSPPITWVLVLAAAAAVIGLVAKNRLAIVLTTSAVVSGLAFWLVPEGRLWNARLLPFYYLSLLLLVAVGLAEASRAVAALLPTDRPRVPGALGRGARHGLRPTTMLIGLLGAATLVALAGGFGSAINDAIPAQEGPARVIGLAVCVVLLATVVALRWVLQSDEPVIGWQRIVRVASCGAVALATLGLLASTTRTLPFGVEQPDGTYEWLWTDQSGYASFIRSWSKWNYEGYEGKPAWPEYHDIVATMADVGQTNGCGRAMWEHEEQHDRYGTPMALMLLPFWTDGCIGSMEGLYFEASSTTPYHFLNQDELSYGPSNAQRDLPYVPGPPTQEQFDLGVAHMQMLGVRYYMAITGRMQDLAAANPDLEEVAASGPWKVYEVAGSELVASLTAEPAVVTGIPTVGHPWLDLAVRWYQDPAAWQVPLADGGPPEWQRIACTYDEAAEEEGATYGGRGSCEDPEVRSLDPVEVTGIEEGRDSISFDVDRVGVPVVVKVSYFPNWEASGAEGPWRLTPNLMVVVPTSEHVELRYGRTTVDWAAMGLSLVGLVWLVYLFRAPPLRLGRTDEDAELAAHPPDPFGPQPRAAAAPASLVVDAPADAAADRGVGGPPIASEPPARASRRAVDVDPLALIIDPALLPPSSDAPGDETPPPGAVPPS